MLVKILQTSGPASADTCSSVENKIMSTCVAFREKPLVVITAGAVYGLAVQLGVKRKRKQP